ncbi:MAG: L-arabinose isomerase [Chloroflexi bacterium]|nr:L-arabinose isomerase [Chloroflexota bacterium]MBV6435366.1 L-arabinose isomerase [Anaerolineae bacterium]OQY84841.1 MAG: L-arabinose isomerase [Anaerolineae bacterium UTCFX5]RIK22715.1 MAG: L-arabinose isomerase [Chloroflexota bacterium]
MIDLSAYEVWFLTGSQHLYGPETLEQVAAHSREIAAALDAAPAIPTRVVFKPVLTTPEQIHGLCLEANATPSCVGVVAWMHTFSPAKNWIAGLTALKKPLAHLHTQYNRDIPWADIDMDFMNLNQAAHGDREFGFMASRLRLNRKVVVGHWSDAEVQERLGVWSRVACAWADMQGMRVARFGDNMRSVAVTEGDKVEAQMRLGYQVYGYGIGDLVAQVNAATDRDISAMIDAYEAEYDIAPDLRRGGARHDSVREAARIEVGLRRFLKAGEFKAFTTTFEDLHGLTQLPGLSVQRLMRDGFGFGAEGDWKTAALLRASKVMAAGLLGGTSFMEDYTYHLDPAGMRVLGAHMLEICPSIASDKPSLQVHPLGIGGKADPARLVFDTPPGPAINASLVDMGNRFRLIVNDVDVIAPDQPMPKLPVARALWIPQPDLKLGAAAWIYAGGAHHTVFSQSLTAEYMADFAEIAGIEFVRIDSSTTLHAFKNELRWNEMYFALAKGL